MTILGLAAAGWWLLSVAVLLATLVLALAQPRARRRGLVGAAPPVSVIVPVKAPEADFPAALASVLRQARPGDEVIIACAEPGAAILEEARAVLAQFPNARARLHLGAETVVRSPKMNNLLGPIAGAANDLILSKDANAVLADGQLVMLLRHLGPGVGLVTVVTYADRAENFSAQIEAAFMNGYHARLLLAASTLGLGFGLGKVLLFSRAAFETAGGARAMAQSVHEDHAMGALFARAGLRTVIAGQEVSQMLGRRDLAAIWQRQLRWMICRRVDEPAAFILEPFFTCCTTALVALMAGPVFGVSGLWLAGATVLGWYSAESIFLALKHWLPIAPHAWICRELMITLLWLRAWTTNEVEWGGQRLDARRVAPRS